MQMRGKDSKCHKRDERDHTGMLPLRVTEGFRALEVGTAFARYNYELDH